MLPEIYQNIDIGDITLFGGGGGAPGEDGEGGGSEAFQVFGNVMLPMMVMAKMMGFDFKSLMKESLGEFAIKDDDEKKKSKK
jgi:hypothetical protein